jgi:hypothetical protein
MKPLLFFCAVLAFFAACSQNKVPSVDREELFDLAIGRLEDQIDLYNLEGNRSVRKTSVAMRDGLLYISDGNGQKVVRYNSYGDLLFMIYNEETNPPPLTLRTSFGEGDAVTRWAFSYPLQRPGEITVDSRKHIYVEDRLPRDRHGFDVENQVLLDGTVLHFDSDGRFIEYLGQEGIGGTPFPRIERICSSRQDELVVICRLPQGWNVYWFDAEGTLLYLIQLRNDALPAPPGRGNLIPSVDGVYAAPDERRLYLKLDYYREIFDEEGAPAGTGPDSSMIWIMDAETGAYSESLEVPFFMYTFTEDSHRVTETLPYSLIGVMRGARVFLSSPVEEGYSLLMLSAGSRRQRRGLIRVEPDELQYNIFALSDEGILTGLLATEDLVKLVWWRINQLLGIASP